MTVSLRMAVLLTIALTAATAGQAQQAVRRKPPPKPAPAAPAAPTLAPANSDQMAAAAMVHVGDYACEFNESVLVETNRKFDGYVDVKHRKNLWTMKPILSSTGALRLEDVRGHMLMLQIADKSMLMDVKVGRRVVDSCVHEKQREAAARGIQRESIGIDPVKAAAAAAERAASAAEAASAAAARAAAAADAASAAAAAASAVAPGR